MNAYMVRTRDMRSYTEPVMDDGSGPQIPYQPIAPVVAETPAQAKRLFLDEFTNKLRTGVYEDDWNELRVRLLAKNVSLAAGVRESDDALWFRIHEVETHGGKACDCPEPVWDEEMQDRKTAA